MAEIEDRRDDPWPWHQLGAILRDPIQTVGNPPPPEADRTLEPMSSLAMQLGAKQIAPLTPAEMMKFMMDIEMMNPYEPLKRHNKPLSKE